MDEKLKGKIAQRIRQELVRFHTWSNEAVIASADVVAAQILIFVGEDGYRKVDLSKLTILTTSQIKSAWKKWPYDKPAAPTFDQWLCQAQLDKDKEAIKGGQDG